MNISGPDPSGALGKLFLPVEQKESLGHDPRATPSTSPGGTHDEVALSTVAQDVRDVSAKVAQLPDIRGERIQQVRAALDRHEPLASSRQVADAVIRDTIVNSLMTT